jgi:hypothetical protein
VKTDLKLFLQSKFFANPAANFPSLSFRFCFQNHTQERMLAIPIAKLVTIFKKNNFDRSHRKKIVERQLTYIQANHFL